MFLARPYMRMCAGVWVRARVRGCVVLVLILHTVVYYFKGTHEYVFVCFIVVFCYVRHLERIYAFAPYKDHSDWLITITSSKMKM